MSRSRRKTRIQGITTADSEKENKRMANRRLRRRVKHSIKTGKELPKLREVLNVWAFAKDGKRYVANMSEKQMRK